MSTFLDLFTYESVTQGAQNRIFNNCRFLRPVGRFKEGDIVHAITIYLNLYVWSSEYDYDEEIIFL